MTRITLEVYSAYDEFGLIHRLNEVARYRQESSEKFPHDTRNAKAVDLINNLLGQTPSPLAVKALNDAIVEYDERCRGVEFDSNPPPFEPKVSTSLGSIGFGWHPKGIDEVLTVLATDARLAAGEVAQR
ncbi:hypothetical protein [Bradyrhizobium sp. LB11.1]|uniref:hypothetical protein n=1 Tax=Bradyrhizobium sp. LB11.1 TaxID=3156326 RepID=UPI003398C049